MAVEWPITPIIDQSPISRLCNFFTAARKKQEAQKVAAAKWLRKRKGTGQGKKIQNGQSQKNYVYAHAPNKYIVHFCN